LSFWLGTKTAKHLTTQHASGKWVRGRDLCVDKVFAVCNFGTVHPLSGDNGHVSNDSFAHPVPVVAGCVLYDFLTDRRMTFAELIKHNGASMSDSALEQRARRMARKQDKFITKVDPRSRWYGQYGSYMVSDLYTNTIVAYGINTADELVNYFAEEHDALVQSREVAEKTGAKAELVVSTACQK